MIRPLLEPRAALRAAAAEPRPAAAALLLGGLLLLLGGLTLPKQLPALTWLLEGPGGPPHGALLREGLGRLATLDRLLPPLTPVLAAWLAYQLSAAWLGDTAPARRARAAVLVAGLTPLLVLRLGELATVWLIPFDGFRPGDVLNAPRLFATGPVMLLARDGSTAALDLLDARVNLVTAWIIGLWTVGFRSLDGGRSAPWHVLVPLVAFAVAAAVTWWLATPVASMVLRGI